MAAGAGPGEGEGDRAGTPSLWAARCSSLSPRWRPAGEAPLRSTPFRPAARFRSQAAPGGGPGILTVSLLQGLCCRPVPWPTHRPPEAAGPCGGGGREGGGEPERDRPEVRRPGRAGRALLFASCWEVLSPSVVFQPRKERQ